MYIIDQALSSLPRRFEQFKVYEDTFGFLFDLKKSNFSSNECLMANCANLEKILKHDGVSDIDGRDLFLELKVLKDVLPKETKKPIEVLNFLKVIDDCFPNT